MEDDRDDFGQRAALVGRRVRVALMDGTSARGLLVGADPETRHVALVQAADASGRVRLQLLLPHHVRGVSADEDADADGDALLQSLANLDPGTTGHESQCGGEARLAQLAAFLERVRAVRRSPLRKRTDGLYADAMQHFVPFEVEADGALRLFGGAATLLPPFTDADESVASENEQLVGRLRALLARFLDDGGGCNGDK